MKSHIRIPYGLQRFARSNCAAATPEYTILTFAIVSILILSVAPLGFQIKDTLQTLNHDDHQGQEIASPRDGSTTGTESPRRTQSVRHKPPALGWMNAMPLAAVTLTFVWLLLRKKSRRKIKKPRPLEASTQVAESQQLFEKRQQIMRIVSNNRDDLLRGHLEVRHLATKEPITIAPDQSVEAAREMMVKYNVDYLLVCNADRSLVGFVSKHYLERNHFKRVVDAMATQPLFVSPNALLNPTVTHMLNEGVFCVAVVQDDKAVGVLTATDIQLTLQVTLQILAKTTTETRPLENADAR